DTGCGLERLASVVQGKKTNFETDLLYPIIEYASKVSGVKYGEDEAKDVSLKVIADHARSMAIMIMDGILPSNEGRGYVLRRILRRAIRHGRMLGIKDKFLEGAVDAVVEIYKDASDFGELVAKHDYIKKVISIEEDRFAATLNQGMELLGKEVEELKAAGKKELPGAIGFRLYDTYGFPWELTEEILHEQGLDLDKAGFDKAMDEQRQRARAARAANIRVQVPDLSGIDVSKLTVDPEAKESKVVAIWKDGKLVDEIHDGEEAGIILEQTPFYAEGGGQVGDEGYLLSEFGRIHATNAKKLPDGTVYHISYVEEGQLKVGDTVKIEVDRAKKLASARNHTATHLLQAALKRVVGDQVNQAGSSVTPERLRFDFTNFEPVSAQQLADVEELVNEEILKGIDVEITHMALDEAKKAGAMALFSEKYGDVVRVVKVPGFSMELCGGSHVKNIGQIGAFKIVAETGVASGVRRIEALTGKAALDYLNGKAATLASAGAKLKAADDDVPAAVDKLLAEKKTMEAQLAEVAEMREKADAKKLLASVEDVNGVPVACGVAHAANMDELREVADLSASKLDGGVVVLACVNDGKVSLVVKAAKEAVKKGVHAGKVIKEAAAIVGGGGGGRPDMAQAGGKNPEALPKAFEKAVEVLKAQLG
ncbi:alanine--tRNA ligase, partial [Selenomonas sp.]|uniref:alanine--tRNA ligase n=1 Tax=Selenomonas sp. TaxID=2053611 RepID=UPI002A764DDC